MGLRQRVLRVRRNGRESVGELFSKRRVDVGIGRGRFEVKNLIRKPHGRRNERTVGVALRRQTCSVSGGTAGKDEEELPRHRHEVIGRPPGPARRARAYPVPFARARHDRRRCTMAARALDRWLALCNGTRRTPPPTPDAIFASDRSRDERRARADR